MLTNKELVKKQEIMTKYKYYCKCGHSVVIPPINKKGIAECSYCHNNVFRDKQTEFKYRMNEILIREKRNRK